MKGAGGMLASLLRGPIHVKNEEKHALFVIEAASEELRWYLSVVDPARLLVAMWGSEPFEEPTLCTLHGSSQGTVPRLVGGFSAQMCIRLNLASGGLYVSPPLTNVERSHEPGNAMIIAARALDRELKRG